MSGNGKIPLMGRIIHRPGNESWWQLGRVSLDGKFERRTFALRDGDVVYDYTITNAQTGTAVVRVSTMVEGRTEELKCEGIFEIQAGQLSGLDLMSLEEGPGNFQILGH